MRAVADFLLRLARVERLGALRMGRLLRNAECDVCARPDPCFETLAAAAGLGPGGAAAIARAMAFDTSPLWEAAERCGARAVTWCDDDYPTGLRRMSDPPGLLWVRGTLPHPDSRLVAVVGTRKATPYGRAMARALGEFLVRNGVGVVSGLARGIDGEAHRGALAGRGWTGAVLGCGIDRIYPPEHRGLAVEMLGQGAIVSEFDPGERSAAHNFPRRNRIIAGLCGSTVVVEAGEKGGAQITARLARDYEREVFAIPGPLTSPSSRGCHDLVRSDVARLVSRFEDILGETWVDMAPLSPPERLAEVESALLRAVGPVGTGLEALCDATGMEHSAALVTLLDLELRGYVLQVPGRQFLRTALADRAAPFVS